MSELKLRLRLSIIFMLLLQFGGIYAQMETKIDSLRQVIAKAESAAEKVEPMKALFLILINQSPEEAGEVANELEAMAKANELAEAHVLARFFVSQLYQRQSKFDSLNIITSEGIKLAEKQGFAMLTGQFYNMRGIYHEKAGMLDSAIYYYEKALPFDGVKRLAIYNNLGVAYNRKKDLYRSIEYLLQGMEEAKKEKNINAQAVLANNIGGTFSHLGFYDKMETYCLWSIELKDQIGDERGKLFALTNLLDADVSLKKHRDYLKQAQQIAAQIKDPFFISLFKEKEAEVLLKEGAYQQAIALALPLYEEGKKEADLNFIQTLGVLTDASLALEKVDQAQKYAEALMVEAQNIGSVDYLQYARERQLAVYQKIGDFTEYGKIAQVYYPLSDSLNRASNLNKLAYMDAELRDIEQEKKIALLNASLNQKEIRRYWIIAVATLIALILSLFVYFRTKQVRTQKLLIEQEQKTTRKLAAVNEELKNLDQMKSRFFTNISHELRTPVTLIATPVTHLLQQYNGQMHKEVKRSLEMVGKNARKLLALVEELLEFSRLDAGKSGQSPSPTHLHSFFKQLFSAYESLAELKHINYQFSFHAKEEMWLQLDQKQVGKIVNNLLSNALKFTPEGGTVSIEVDTTDNQLLQITVADNGRGILPEDLPLVFDRYFQTKSKNLPTEGGTGIGLAFSNELAKLLDGKLEVESQWGQGSTFRLYLPAIEAAAGLEKPTVVLTEKQPLPLPDPDEAETSIIPLSGRSKILIVEDNLDMQQLITTLLGDTYDYVLVNNGQEAWNLLKTNDPSTQDISLILSDVMMPQMDGYALLNHIKQHDRWANYPVIMLTARASEKDKLKALRKGVDDYLTKPFSPAELMARIQNLLNNYHQRQAVQEEMIPVKPQFARATSLDQTWLEEIETIALNALERQIDLNANYLANEMAISARQLSRKVKALTGLSIGRYIQEIKLQKARYLLESKSLGTIAEVVYACGFKSPSYFAQLFSQHFGKLPSDFMQD